MLSSKNSYLTLNSHKNSQIKKIKNVVATSFLRNASTSSKLMINSKTMSTHQINNAVKKQNLGQLLNCQNSGNSVNNIRNDNANLLQENILNKLLLPPNRKQSLKKISQESKGNGFHGTGQKFQQKKPDIEELIQENIKLKKQILQLKKNLLNFKTKEQQLEKKLKKYQSTQTEKIDQIIQQIKDDKNIGVLVDILKKKIHEVQVKYLNAQEEIKRLKRLPNSNIFEENNIEKQHYITETIRLKSILASYQFSQMKALSTANSQKHICESVPPSHLQSGTSTPFSRPSSKNNSIVSNLNQSTKSQNFGQQFLQMLKQQNQKLKSTIRLLENEKILLKSHNKIYKDKYNNHNKELETLKQKLLLKQSEIEKLINQNKNLLFKKATQFKIQQQTTENKVICSLEKKLEECMNRCKKLQDDNQLLVSDNLIIKQREKNKSKELIEKENKYEFMRVQMAEMESRFQQRIKSLQIGKSLNRSEYCRNSINYKWSKKNRNQTPGKPQQSTSIFNQILGKDVKFKDVQLSLLKLISLKQDGIIKDYSQIFQKSKANDEQKSLKPQLKSSQGLSLLKISKKENIPISSKNMMKILSSEPLCFTFAESQKFINYIFNDLSTTRQKQDIVNKNNSGQQLSKQQQFKERLLEKSIILNIIKASVNKITQCLVLQDVINCWKCLLGKNRKFLSNLQKLIQTPKELSINQNQPPKKFMSLQQFIEILARNKNDEITEQQINFMAIHAFSRQKSQNQIMLSIEKIVSTLHYVSKESLDTIIEKSSHYFSQSKQNRFGQIQKLLAKNNLQNKNNIQQKATQLAPLAKNSLYLNRNIRKAQQKQDPERNNSIIIDDPLCSNSEIQLSDKQDISIHAEQFDQTNTLLGVQDAGIMHTYSEEQISRANYEEKGQNFLLPQLKQVQGTQKNKIYGKNQQIQSENVYERQLRKSMQYVIKIQQQWKQLEQQNQKNNHQSSQKMSEKNSIIQQQQNEEDEGSCEIEDYSQESSSFADNDQDSQRRTSQYSSSQLEYTDKQIFHEQQVQNDENYSIECSKNNVMQISIQAEHNNKSQKSIKRASTENKKLLISGLDDWNPQSFKSNRGKSVSINLNNNQYNEKSESEEQQSSHQRSEAQQQSQIN